MGGGGSNRKNHPVYLVLCTKRKNSDTQWSQVVKGLQLWSGTQHMLFCRESKFVASYTRDEGGGGSQKVTNDDEGERGGHDTP